MSTHHSPQIGKLALNPTEAVAKRSGNEKSPAASATGDSDVRPKGFEPLTF